MANQTCESAPTYTIHVQETVTVTPTTSASVSAAEATSTDSSSPGAQSTTKSIVTTIITKTETTTVTKPATTGSAVSTASADNTIVSATPSFEPGYTYVPLNISFVPLSTGGSLSAIATIHSLNATGTNGVSSGLLTPATTSISGLGATTSTAEPSVSVLTLGSAGDKTDCSTNVALALVALIGWFHI